MPRECKALCKSALETLKYQIKNLIWGCNPLIDNDSLKAIYQTSLFYFVFVFNFVFVFVLVSVFVLYCFFAEKRTPLSEDKNSRRSEVVRGEL